MSHLSKSHERLSQEKQNALPAVACMKSKVKEGGEAKERYVVVN